jgi:hypothetical protein
VRIRDEQELWNAPAAFLKRHLNVYKPQGAYNAQITGGVRAKVVAAIGGYIGKTYYP